jgi:lysozyme
MLKKLLVSVGIAVLIFFAQQLSFIQTLERDIVAITESTFKLLVQFEGKRNKAYQDSKGLWTIGIGHLIKPTEQHLLHAVLTDEQVEELFRSDLKWCDEAIATSVKVSITQNQYDALTSLCYNIGDTQFKKSSVVRTLNEGNYAAAAEHFLDWVNPSVLKPRRQKEKELFLSPIKGENT